MTNRRLYRLVHHFKEAILAALDDQCFSNDIVFYQFPRGCCGDTSCLLAEYLHLNGFELYKIIRDAYKQESGSAQWQSEIMYSKWWLPLFKISRYDSHDYDHFMKSNNFPQLLRIFPAHSEGLE